MVIRIIHISLFILFMFSSKAQSAYSFVKKGNKEIAQEKYSEAEILYRKSLDRSPKETVPLYNIGVSQYHNNNFEEAKKQFTSSAENFSTKEDKAHAFHNLGNSLLSEKKYEESIDAYKSALKLVPEDMDTKYNLAYAQLMLKKEQEQQQEQQNQENEDKQDQDKNEDKKEQDKQQDKQEGEDEQKDGGENSEDERQDKEEQAENQENKNQENQENEQAEQPKELKLSKEQAEKLLKALENEEGKLQEKLDKPEGDPVKINIEKDW